MNQTIPKAVAFTFLISAMLAPIGVLAAWTGSQAAAWTRDVAVLTSTATGIVLWLMMRRARASAAGGE